MGLISMEKPGIQRIEQRYLDIQTNNVPIAFVRSSNGISKTRWLEKIVQECKMGRGRESSNESVLLIEHRRSLVQSASERLELTSYLNYFSNTNSLGFSDVEIYNGPTNHYAICVDSLVKQLSPEHHKYDVVIIDEVEQIPSHLTGSTIKDKRRETFLYFKHYLDQIKKLLVLDADLNELMVNVLYDLISDRKK